MEFDFSQEKPKRRKPAYKKPAYWVTCLDCRAIYADKIHKNYPNCKFCNGSHWSNDV